MGPRFADPALLCYSPAIRLAAEPEADAPAGAPVWVQIGVEGEWHGHQNGAFQLAVQDLQQIVSNFRSHPSYQRGASGWGESRVVAWDFHHASEMPPSEIAAVGAPAQGWALDLDVRAGADGTATIWALTEFLEPARTYVGDDRYQWCSMALNPSTKHPVTGEEIGWYLSSIAMTNDPFIQGMVPMAIAASRAQLQARMLLELDGDLDDLVRELRWTFGLGELAGVDAIMAELQKLRGFMAAGEAPPGVDLDDMISRLRSLLGLPKLSEAALVLAETDKLISRLVESAQPDPVGQPAAPVANSRSNPEPSESNAPGSYSMDFTKILAERFGIPNDEASVQKRILAELDAGADATKQLQALIKALGVEDSAAAMKRIVDLVKNSSDLLEAMPQLEQLKAAKLEDEEKAVEEDVDEVMAARGYTDPGVKVALLSLRSGGIELTKDSPKEDWDRRAAAAKQFKETYPLPERGQGHLLSRLAVPVESGRAQPAAPPPPPGTGNGGLSLDAVNACAGRNITEKAMAFVRSRPGGDGLSYEAVHEAACSMLANFRSEGVQLPQPPGKQFDTQ